QQSSAKRAAEFSIVRTGGTSRRAGRSDDKPLLCEVLVEGHRGADPLSPHQDEARAVREAVRLVRSLLEEGPGRPLIGRGAGQQLDDRQVKEGTTDGDSPPVSETCLRECHRLIEDVARGDEPPW